MEQRSRSGVKSIIWRITGIFILAVVTYAFTGSWIKTGLITFIHHGISLVMFYFHERLWLMIGKSLRLKTRSIFKMITYETIGGNIILGFVTYMITGEIKQMTQITLVYIGIKHVVYIWNEFIWYKVKWRKN